MPSQLHLQVMFVIHGCFGMEIADNIHHLTQVVDLKMRCSQTLNTINKGRVTVKNVKFSFSVGDVKSFR